MSLIKCSECGEEFSVYANSCPKCGCPTSKVIELGRSRLFKLKLCEKYKQVDPEIVKNLIIKVLGYFESDADFIIHWHDLEYKDEHVHKCYEEDIAQNVTLDQVEIIAPIFWKHNIDLVIFDVNDIKISGSKRANEIPFFHANTTITEDDIKEPVLTPDQHFDVRKEVIIDMDALHAKCRADMALVNAREKAREASKNLPTCPTCGSTNIQKISGLNRAAHGYMFGLFSKTAKSQFCCKNCGYKW